MKRILAVVWGIFLVSSAAVAQEFTLSGFARSGIFWEKSQNYGLDAKESVTVHSKDDAGNAQGRVRFDLEYRHKNMGMKTRIQWDNWRDPSPDWTYAFIYGHYFSEQLTLAVGKLGESPWRTGGPEMWKELEVSTAGGGIRTEYKPSFVPGLNVGFVLNYFNNPGDQGWPQGKPFTLLEILRESVLGIAYEHDLFIARFAFRFDSDYDAIAGNAGTVSAPGGHGEEEYVFRVEERVLSKYLPNFQIWALGHGIGWNAPKENHVVRLQNWLFAEYNPEYFTAQIRLGYDYTDSRSIFHVRPSFYWKFFGNLLNVGVSFWYGQDFGENKIFKNSLYNFIELEPRLQVNFGNSSYVAFVYNYRREFVPPYDVLGATEADNPLKQTQWINLRFCMSL